MFSYNFYVKLYFSVYFPSRADEYPVIYFIAGLNGYVWVEWYSLYLKMLASHGFFVIGVDYLFPVYSYTNNNKLSQDISKFFDEITFVSYLFICLCCLLAYLLLHCGVLPSKH